MAKQARAGRFVTLQSKRVIFIPAGERSKWADVRDKVLAGKKGERSRLGEYGEYAADVAREEGMSSKEWMRKNPYKDWLKGVEREEREEPVVEEKGPRAKGKATGVTRSIMAAAEKNPYGKKPKGDVRKLAAKAAALKKKVADNPRDEDLWLDWGDAMDALGLVSDDDEIYRL